MSAIHMQVPFGLTTDGLPGKRYLARTIDAMVLIPLFVLFMAAGVAPAVLVLSPLVWLGYGALMESSSWQATIGKRVMGLKVYDGSGRRLTLLQAAYRSLVKEGPFLLLAFMPGGQWVSSGWLVAHLIVIHRSPVSQAIHDRLAGTWVAAPEETTQLRLS